MNDDNPASRWPVAAGVFGTVAYMITMAVYSYAMRAALFNMTPHDFAEYLAGIFGPLAFIWIVLGYHQQGVELRHSARALYLQGEELRHSVAAQQDMAKTQREQLQDEKATRERELAERIKARKPNLRLLHEQGMTGHKASINHFALFNHGMKCHEIEIWAEGVKIEQKLILEQDKAFNFQFTSEFEELRKLEVLEIEILYKDADGVDGSDKFEMRVVKSPYNDVCSLEAPVKQGG